MSGIKLGQYIYGTSLLHRLDPRTKIISCLILVISVLLNFSWYYLLFLLALVMLAIYLSDLQFRFILSSLRSIRSLLIVTFLFQAVLTAGEPVIDTALLDITREGLIIGAINLLRLIILYLGSIVLLATTSPMQLSAGIEYLLAPLVRIKVPVHNTAAILSISFRFIPTLVEEASTIKKAQSSRGAQFDSPGLIVRLQSYLAIVIPLFEASLARAADLGEAMDSRCYSPRSNQIRLRRLSMSRQDIAVLAFMLLVPGLGLLLILFDKGVIS